MYKKRRLHEGSFTTSINKTVRIQRYQENALRRKVRRGLRSKPQTTAKCYLLVLYDKKLKILSSKVLLCSETIFARHLTWSVQNKERHWLLQISKWLWLACHWNNVSRSSVLNSSWTLIIIQFKLCFCLWLVNNPEQFAISGKTTKCSRNQRPIIFI